MFTSSSYFNHQSHHDQDLTSTINTLSDANSTTTTNARKANDDEFVQRMKMLREKKRQRRKNKKKKNKKKRVDEGAIQAAALTQPGSEIKAQVLQPRDPTFRLYENGRIQGDFMSSSKYAYAFLLVDCDPNHPSTYLHYLYNIAVATELLQYFGSKEDIIVMIRMLVHANDTNDTNDTKKLNHHHLMTNLPPDHERILTKLGITVIYTPPVTKAPNKIADVHKAMDKFRILQLTDYERILYLDAADVIPLNNLDYLFQFSSGPNAKLEENVVLMDYDAPVNGGIFMLRPNQKDYEDLRQLIDKKVGKEEETDVSGSFFDPMIGWGHTFHNNNTDDDGDDHWESMLSNNGTKWDFPGASTDIGLIYYWTKYVQQNISIIGRDTIQTWKSQNGKVKMIKQVPRNTVFGNNVEPADVIIKPQHRQSGARSSSIDQNDYDEELSTIIPYRDFHHCKEEDCKPWNVKTPPDVVNDIADVKDGPIQLWYHMLRTINAQNGFGIDTEKLLKIE